MSARSVARVIVSLGMTQIGIKLYLVANSEPISFNMFNSKTKNRVGQKWFDKETNKDVTAEDIIKGYGHIKDQFVFFTDEEIANIQAGKKDFLEISEFVPASEINPLHVEKNYYLQPDKGMDKGYKLLYEMLRAQDKVAVGTWSANKKEHLVVIRAYQHGLIMHQMFYDTEIRSFDNACKGVEFLPTELMLGKILMETLSKPAFDKSRYSDRFIDKLNNAVQAKLKGEKITEVKTAVVSTAMSDSLRDSLSSLGIPAKQIEETMIRAGISIPNVVEPLVLTSPTAKKSRAKRTG
jgi:DNA end-binding protein Ku